MENKDKKSSKEIKLLSKLKEEGMRPEEYSSIKSEIIETINIQQNYIIAMYTLVIAIIGYAWETKNVWLLLLPYVILFSFQRIIDSKKYHWIKLAAILAVFSDDIWETNFDLLNKVIETKYAKKRKLHHFHIIRVSSLHLAFGCSLLCVICNVTDFFNGDIMLLSRAYISAIAISLFIIMVSWCWNALDSKKKRDDYIKALEDKIKSEQAEVSEDIVNSHS